MSEASGSSPQPQHYLIGGALTAVAWASCAVGALATYKPHRVVHNFIGVSQACTSLPLVWACSTALATAAASEGALRRPEHRRLHLGLAASSIWSAITVWWSAVFTAALVRTVDPVIYPLPLRAAATLAHLCTALLCLYGWRQSLVVATPLVGPPPSLWRVSAGVADSFLQLAPRAASFQGEDNEEGSARPVAAVLGALSLSFGTFAALALCAPFPLVRVAYSPVLMRPAGP